MLSRPAQLTYLEGPQSHEDPIEFQILRQMSFLGRFFHAAPHEEEKSGMSSDPHISENTQDHHSSELGLFAGLSISSPAILQPPLREEKRQEYASL